MCAVWDIISQKHIGGMYYNLPFISQHPSDLSWTPALLQLKVEQVVMPTEADQDPLTVVHFLAC